MNKENYHHGMLKEELIKNGLLLINKEGLSGFSLRKVATLCGVSHTAPYKHFKNKEELLSAISERVSKEFTEYLAQAARQNVGLVGMIEMGKAYIGYMVKNKEYFEFMFFGELKFSVKLQNGTFIYDEKSPFATFYEAAKENLKQIIPDEQSMNMTILNMWSQVHGLTTLIINQIVEYDENIEELLEQMLTSFKS